MNAEPTAEIDRLHDVAQAATIGPWTAEAIGSEGYHVFGPEGSRAPMKGRARVAACTWQDWDEAAADAEFIAAFDPPTVLALLDALERVRALADEWELRAGEDSAAWRAFGPQDVSVPFAVKSIRDALNRPAPTTGREADDA